MLYYETIDSKTLELLINVQRVPEFNNLRLVGGTSLALQIGHRKSIDLDLFGEIDTDYITISKRLDNIGTVTTIKNSENIKVFIVNNIKVDIVNYHYKWLEDEIKKDDLILATSKDIIAMKLAAITGRGTKKDFIDLFYLLHQYTLKQAFDFYSKKYHDGSVFMVLKSLSYFDDAEEDEDPIMLKKYLWEDTKLYIKDKIERYLKER